jgi:hypothetical protein
MGKINNVHDAENDGEPQGQQDVSQSYLQSID